MDTSNLYAVETKSPKNQHSQLNRMDAIACGVHARFEESTGYTKKITDTTISIARTLGVPEAEINKWEVNRSVQLANETEKIRQIKDILEKHYGNSLGITA